jgi:site-specific DNA recombinase
LPGDGVGTTEPLDLEYLIPRFDSAEPRDRGPERVPGEIVGQGLWEPLVPEETWRAVRTILEDPARVPPRGVRTLLGGLARCPCGNTVTGMPSHTGRYIYRRASATRDVSYTDGHVARQAAPVEEFVVKLVIARLSRPDAAGLLAAPESGADVAALREEAAAIRATQEEMARDRVLGLVTRAQVIAATDAGNARLAQELEDAARENVLAPLVAAANDARVWEDMDLSRKRAVIRTLITITLAATSSGCPRRGMHWRTANSP